MIRACIDIGTNSVKLLIVNIENREIRDNLLYRTAATRLGQGVSKTRELLPKAIDDTVRAIESYLHEAEKLGAGEIISIATSAVRDAGNRDVFVRKVMERTGLETLVLSGDEEARFAYIGACSNQPELRSKKIVLVDVGGGSSEFVIAENGIIDDQFSIQAGFIRLTEAFLHSDPVDPAELEAITAHIKSLLESYFDGFDMGDRHLVSACGTIRILENIMYLQMGQYAPKDKQKRSLQRNEINGLLRYLSRMKIESRKKTPGLPPDRADVIVAGAAIFSTIMDMLDAKEILLTDRGMRYGVLIDADRD